MAVNFPANREEAGLGYGPLQQGDPFVFNSIEYTWVLSEDGATGMWSSKGININPDRYISKEELFENNGGAISGAYSGSPFEVSIADLADDLSDTADAFYRNASNINDGTLSDARLPDSISSNITGNAASATNASKLANKNPSHYTNASNIDTGTLNKARLPSTIDSNTTGSAAEADKVANTLNINFYAAGQIPGTDQPTKSVTYDGSVGKIIDIVDTDEASVVLGLDAGKGIKIENDEISVRSSIARTTNASGFYVVNEDNQFLRVQQADNATLLGNQNPEYYLDYSNFTNTPTPGSGGGTTYTGGSGIIVDGSKIQVKPFIARSGTLSSSSATSSEHVCRVDNSGNLQFLKSYQADNALKLGNIAASSYATKSYVNSAINNITGGTVPNLQSVFDASGSRAIVSGSNAIQALRNNNNEVLLNAPDGGMKLRKYGSSNTAAGAYIIFGDRTSANRVLLQQQGDQLVVSSPSGSFPITAGGSGGGGGASTLNQLTDVNTSGLFNGAVLKYNGAQWVPGTDEQGSGGGGSSAFPGDKVFIVDIGSGFNAPETFTASLRSCLNLAIAQGGHVFIPAGTHILTEHIVTNNRSVKHQVSVFGAGGYSTEIITEGYRIFFRHPVNIRNLAINNGGYGDKGAPSGLSPSKTAMINFWREGMPSGTAQEDDMDSSMMDCTIQGPAYGYTISHRGRNFKFHNNRVLKAGSGAVGALFLDYANAEGSVSDIQGPIGFRRISILGNTFHAWAGSCCITFGFPSNVPAYGILIEGNTVDHGGKFLRTLSSNTSNKCFKNSSICNNTMHFVSSSDTPSIDIHAVGCSIIGNSIGNKSANQPGIEVNGIIDSDRSNQGCLILNPQPIKI